MNYTRIHSLIIAAILMLSSELMAKVSQEEAAKLGGELTPIGAISAASSDGTIPKWTGGYNDPSGYTDMGELKDPYPDDKILFTITSQNADQYKDKISAGQYAMLKRYPSWKMNVYTTRRTAGFTEDVVQALKTNALNAELTSDGNGVTNSTMTCPFPIPKNGLEIAWNINLLYSVNYQMDYIYGAPTPSGNYEAVRVTRNCWSYPYCQKGATTASVDNILWKTIMTFRSPPIEDGRMRLLIEHIDQDKDVRFGWVFLPNAKAVRRTPDYQFDSPTPSTGNQLWSDMIIGMMGSPEKYDWKLIGKKEMYVPYNNYRITNRSLKYSELILPGHLNSDYLRYELHRVWVVEATLKAGQTHICPKKTLYVDEDSYIPVVFDYYNSGSTLWRVAEFYDPLDYVSKGFSSKLAGYYDLLDGRYAFYQLRNNEAAPIKRGMNFPDTLFTPATLSAQGM